jgi:hypothetical protein
LDGVMLTVWWLAQTNSGCDNGYKGKVLAFRHLDIK